MQLLLFILILIWNLFVIGRETHNAPATVQVVSTSTKVDSSFLAIKIYKDKYSVSLLKDSLTAKSIAQIDNFISKNTGRIDLKKILVIGEKDVQYLPFKKLKDVLKKHEILKFRIETIDPVP